jgi:signal transduction histidine kinase
VGNALDSLRGSGTPGRIIVRSLKRGRNHVQVEVEDSGPGLPPDVRDRAFDPFFTTKPNGLGLGLSLCRSIIETHGGELWATSSGERGAIFHFTLPVEELGRRRDDG